MSDSRSSRRNRRPVVLALAAALLLSLIPTAAAAQVDTDAVYCFQSTDFPTGTSEALTGICVTGVPEARHGLIRLGSRVICPGDILTVAQIDAMTFHPTAGGDTEAQVTYLPISENRVEQEAVMTLSIRKKENKPPVAQDSTLETYKNLENTGTLSVTDPEGGALTYTLVQEPKRGQVTIGDDGTFTYTPTKNKVGKDSFTFTATDEAGAVSNEATVSIEILKPLNSDTYKDVTSGQFEALWMKNTGLFSGSQVAGESCFGPGKEVTRGDFLAMVMKLLEIPLEDTVSASGFADEGQAAAWLQPYLATAMRLGVVSGARKGDQVVFRPNDPITGAEAAVMLQNVLLLPKGTAVNGEDAPAWAQDSVAAMVGSGISIENPGAVLTRMDTAKLLYQVSKLAPTAPGLEVFRQTN